MGPWVRYPTKQLIVFRQNHNGLNLRKEESWEAGHPHFGALVSLRRPTWTRFDPSSCSSARSSTKQAAADAN